MAQPSSIREFETMETNVAGNGYGELWAMLNQVYWAMVRAAENELRKVGLSMIQAAVLFLVKGAQEPVTPAKLSRWLFREPHTVSGLLNRMQRQGLVKKSKDLARRNLVRVTLTKKGEQAYQQQSELRVIRKVLSSLSSKERDNLKTYLRALREEALEELVVKRHIPFP